MAVIYRQAVESDALGVLDVYRAANMITLDEQIIPGSKVEFDFWKDWLHKWEWRINQPSQHFIVALIGNEIVGVARGGVIYNQDTGAIQSMLQLRQNEVKCINATDERDVVQYGLCGEEKEEEELGPVCQNFDAEVSGLFVKTAFQNKGIGSVLLRELLKSMNAPQNGKQQFNSITVWTWIDNVHALRFYEREGGRRVGCRKRHKAIVRLVFDNSSFM